MTAMRSFLTFLFALAVLPACAPPEPIRIGFIGGLSGRVADLGTGGLQGARLAVELRNKAGGIKGRPIELLEVDDQQDPDIAVKAFASLIDRKALAVVGPMTSAVAMAIVPRANQTQTVLMSPTVTTGDLFGLDDYFFRVIPATKDFVRTNADYTYHVLGLRRLQIVFDLGNRSYSESWLNEFSRFFAANGGTLLPPIPFTSSDQTAFPELARAALRGKPQGILLIANSVDAAALTLAIRSLDTRVALGTSEWAATERLAELGGKWVEGMTVAQFFERDSQSPAYLRFRTEYQNRFTRAPGFAETFSFDATNVVLEAIEHQAPQQTLKASLLARPHFAGVQRPINFDKNGDTLGQTFMVSIQRGVFLPLRPKRPAD